MGTWTADIMTDPARGHCPFVEIREDEHCRAWLYQDDSGKTQLRVYEGPEMIIPVEWLVGIIRHFDQDLKTSEKPR